MVACGPGASVLCGCIRFIVPPQHPLNQNSRRGPSRSGRVCVQGLVTYTDATADTGGLCVIPGSHLDHDKLCERARSARAGSDFVSVDADDPILKCGGVFVCAQAGGADSKPHASAVSALFSTSSSLQICCCGTAGLCIATPLPFHSIISSRYQRMSGCVKLQRSLGSSFGCAAMCAWCPVLMQHATSCALRSSCFQTGMTPSPVPPSPAPPPITLSLLQFSYVPLAHTHLFPPAIASLIRPHYPAPASACSYWVPT